MINEYKAKLNITFSQIISLNYYIVIILQLVQGGGGSPFRLQLKLNLHIQYILCIR